MKIKQYSMFIDESGMANPKTHNESPYYVLNGFVIPTKSRPKLKDYYEKLKLSYFGSKSYVIHSCELKRDIKRKKRSLERFSTDYLELLNKISFFLLSVAVDKKRALDRSWLNTTVYERTSRKLLKSLILFLIANKTKGSVYIEASEPEKDLITYKSFFHYLANGIENNNITPEEVKKHLTNIAFVTKYNNDPEEQISDIFAYARVLKEKVESGIIRKDILDKFDLVILDLVDLKHFTGKLAKSKRKVELYSAIQSLAILPPKKQKTG